jgi:hypothetical protein
MADTGVRNEGTVSTLTGRRDFMKAIFSIGGLIQAAIGLPAIAYVVARR